MAGVSRVLKGITTANAQGGELTPNRRIDATANTKKELRDSSTVGDSLLLQARSVSAPVARPDRGRRLVAIALALGLLGSLGVRTVVRAGDWESNTTLADSVLACYPSNMKVLAVMAERESRAGRHDGARTILEQVVAARPDSPYALAAMGVFLLERGEDDRAVAMLRQSAESGEPVAGAVTRLALHLLDRADFDGAERVGARALEAGPSFADAALARVARGSALLARREERHHRGGRRDARVPGRSRGA